jgi:hypothetical protein
VSLCETLHGCITFHQQLLATLIGLPMQNNHPLTLHTPLGTDSAIQSPFAFSIPCGSSAFKASFR